MTALAPAHGGAYTALELPATASRQLLVPAALALALALRRVAVARRARLRSRRGLVLAVVHPTYALFLWSRSPASSLVRSLVERRRGEADRGGARGARRAGGRVLRCGCCRWFATRRRTRRAATSCGARCRQYESQLDVLSDTSYRLAPEVFARAGAVAVAALLLVPLAGLALRRRWAAFALGGFLAGARRSCSCRRSSSPSPTPSRSRSPGAPPGSARSRSRSRAGWRCSRRCSVPLLPLVALAAGIVLQLRLSRATSTTGSSDGGPALADVARGRRRPSSRWSTACWRRARVRAADARSSASRRCCSCSRSRSTPPGTGARTGAAAEPADARARRRAPRDVSRAATSVYSDLETSYRIAAYAPVYIAARRRATSRTRRRTGRTSAARQNIRFFEHRRRRDPPRRGSRAGSSSTATASTSSRRPTASTGTSATRSTSCRSRRRPASRS